MKEDDFEELLSTQGFASRPDKKGPRTIAEMRREEMTKEIDPLKLQVTDLEYSTMNTEHAGSLESVTFVSIVIVLYSYFNKSQLREESGSQVHRGFVLCSFIIIDNNLTELLSLSSDLCLRRLTMLS